MPVFKSTLNILNIPDQDEVFNPNWMNSDQVVLPSTKVWDYKRELKIEDVDIWEVIYEASGGIGIYASWQPYAEFYMIRVGWDIEKYGHGIETYYGPGSGSIVYRRAKELGIDIYPKQVWVEDKDVWLYREPESKSNIILLK
jgi:hypothetical protein